MISSEDAPAVRNIEHKQLDLGRSFLSGRNLALQLKMSSMPLLILPTLLL